MMKVKDISYSDYEILKMVYYFQNRSLVRIILDWIKLQIRKKVPSTELLKIKNAGTIPNDCGDCGGKLNLYTGSHTCIRNETLSEGVRWLCVNCFDKMR